MDSYSFLNAVSGEHLEELYLNYLKNPDETEPSLRAFFSGFDFALENYADEAVRAAASTPRETKTVAATPDSNITEHLNKEFAVIALIRAYRERGHLFARTNPIRKMHVFSPTLDMENFGLSPADLQTRFNASGLVGLQAGETLQTILGQLDKVYCASIGIEYNYVRNPEVIAWIENWIFQNQNRPRFSSEEITRILHKLNEGVAFENFLHTKFTGQKRFSLEGLEALIPALDTTITYSAELGVKEVVLGMAHRGRLSVLTNIFKKPFEDVFTEFEGKDLSDDYVNGDVKYHNGWVNEEETTAGKVKCSLLPNPSHLEVADPVVAGFTRARIDADYKGDDKKILPILIHGDSAIAGQGIVYEVLQMSQLDGYKTGGTIHIVTNNQIGFTTNYVEARSSTYCTDVAKTTLAPVMHVNADDPEAVVHAVRFAVDYRQKWGNDVFIDILGYRRYGHNEGDEPRFTQPWLYKIIAGHPNVWELYVKKLADSGQISETEARQYDKKFRDTLEEAYERSMKKNEVLFVPFLSDLWDSYRLDKPEQIWEQADTCVEAGKLREIMAGITSLPAGKKVIAKIEKLLADRRAALESDRQLDWGTAEILAYGSLLSEGYSVRLSGEDVERGTFSHRHVVLREEESEDKICGLKGLCKPQVNGFHVYNSLLSEYGVLGFEYGYAMTSPESLTVWEAQFGDFANGAQTVIDQYISAAEDKWKVQSGLVMFMPHGYEGQGAEHSSGRMERFLQLCAKDNMIICDCTTPANFFHLLRLQQKRSFRKPLVVFTPKSLLRHPLCVSPLSDFTSGAFQRMIDDNSVDRKKVKRLIFCTGKFYYDLLMERTKQEIDNIALVRIEQLYPLKADEIEKIIAAYPKDVELAWAQEEPENMGAWSYLLRKLPSVRFTLFSPAESAAPAPGNGKKWQKRHYGTIGRALTI